MVHPLQSAIIANGVFIFQDPLEPQCLRDLGSLRPSDIIIFGVSHNHGVITSWIHDNK